ncbi:MAG TPA: hypothetical protein VKB89_02285 [Xanthobacteraceae bacterium]|nr:hypothetical protein [Xanthobacteraceae bacterium]
MGSSIGGSEDRASFALMRATSAMAISMVIVMLSAVSKPKTMAPMGSCFHPRNTQVNSKISWIARMGHGLRQQASLMTAVTAAADRRSLSSLLEKLLEEYCHERGFLKPERFLESRMKYFSHTCDVRHRLYALL